MKKCILQRIKEQLSITPIRIKILLLFLIVLLVGSVFSNRNKVETQATKLQKLELENLMLQTKLQEQIAVTDTLVARAEESIKNFKEEKQKVELTIKKKYNEKRDIISNQPIDSAISTLSKWLSETD